VRFGGIFRLATRREEVSVEDLSTLYRYSRQALPDRYLDLIEDADGEKRVRISDV
jgi:hypothetical protein